jgi:hypothetical protein
VTTIAASRDVIVSDSMVSVAHKDIWYPATKLVRGPGLVAGAAGDGGDCSRFLKWAAGGFKPKEVPKWLDTSTDDQIIALIVREDGLYAYSVGDPEPERIEAEFFAIGSGGKAARVAMMLGKTPQEAVEIACQVDLWSALPLQVLSLKDHSAKG